MDQTCWVEVEEWFGHLIEDVLAVPLGKDVLADEGVQVNVHVLENKINIAIVLCTDDLLQLDDVGVT